MAITIKEIDKENINVILPFIKKLNHDGISDEVLLGRIHEMSKMNYQCLGIYDDIKLIGTCGLWFSTRHYCGKTIEPDHVIIDEEYRSKGLGSLLFNWIDQYARKKGYGTIELNSYVTNDRSHKFYFNEGFRIVGFHFMKNLEEQ